MARSGNGLPRSRQADLAPVSQPATADHGRSLARALGRWDLTGLMVNATIGAGILGLPGKVYALAGVWCVPLCLAGAVLAALVAACFAQLGSRFNRTGGAYLFAITAFGPRYGFAIGWLALMSAMLSFATVANLVITYTSALWPALAAPHGRFVAITAMVLGLAVPVYCGVRLSARAHGIFTACKLALLLGFVAISLPALARHGVAMTKLPPLANIAPTLVLLVFAFGGMEATVVSGGEIRRPARDIPFALAAGMLAVAVLYSLVLLGSAALLPDLAASKRPIFDGAVLALGPGAGLIVVVGGAISMTGVLFVILFAGPRILFAMAENGQFPPLLAKLHARWRTPYVAVLVYAAAAWALALNSSFLGALTVATLTRLLLYATSAAALLRLRQRRHCETPAPLDLPGSAPIAWAALALCLAIISQSTPAEFAGVGMVLAPGLAIMALYGRRARAPAPPSREGLALNLAQDGPPDPG
jgi:APA family basic amino acid/polyamine antiporter